MRFLWAFRSNPGCMGEQRICECKFVTSPSRGHQRRIREFAIANSRPARTHGRPEHGLYNDVPLLC
ncbi:MAG: hypothetical protein LBK44_02990 [Spirochaetales bacterium]|nr:hypothetical protein [Spirochaetales bacterium]